MTGSIRGAVVVMTKAPLSGRSKTRLCPPLTPDQAAAVAEAALRDTLDAVMDSAAERRVIALDGDVGDWVPRGVEVIGQRGGGLDERLAAAFADVGGPAIIIAMDTPQITGRLLDDALDRLSRCDAVLGPTDDGGYWTIGLADTVRDVTTGVPMSRPDTWESQVARFHDETMTWDQLTRLVDVDDMSDAVAVAHAIPTSRFGRLVLSLSSDV